MSQQHLGLSNYQRSPSLFPAVHWITMSIENVIYLVAGISVGH